MGHMHQTVMTWMDMNPLSTEDNLEIFFITDLEILSSVHFKWGLLMKYIDICVILGVNR